MNQQQRKLHKWFKEKGWEYWTPHEIMVRLMEESGELARLINHCYGPKKKKSDELEQDMEEEIGDIVYTLMCLANSLDIDLDEAAEKSIAKVVKRDEKRFDK